MAIQTIIKTWLLLPPIHPIHGDASIQDFIAFIFLQGHYYPRKNFFDTTNRFQRPHFNHIPHNLKDYYVGNLDFFPLLFFCTHCSFAEVNYLSELRLCPLSALLSWKTRRNPFRHFFSEKPDNINSYILWTSSHQSGNWILHK